MNTDIAVPKSAQYLKPFVAAGVFEPIDIHAAGSLARLITGLEPEIILGAALAMRAVREGHVCVLVDDAYADIDLSDNAKKLPWPTPEKWRSVLTASPAVRVVEPSETVVVAPGEALVPLVFDGVRIYLDRYYDYELKLADFLLDRSGSERINVDESEIEKTLDEIYGKLTGEIDYQREAVRRALTGRLTVIAGGPGTGKTFTINRLLKASRILDGGRPRAIALAAPTGKAAARMTEALSDGEIKATTLHRLLNITPQHPARFNADNPLPFDLVVVDEASMVQLALMTQLFTALSPNASVVLVGDPSQLASVEAGAVLGDIVTATTPDPDSGSVNVALADCTVTLKRNHRFSAESGIAELSQLVDAGETEAVLSCLRAGHDDVVWIDPSNPDDTARVEQETIAAATQVVNAARNGNAEEALEKSIEHNVVCATRYGKFGVHYWTDKIQNELLNTILDCGADRPWYAGRPIMITHNDYLNNLFNGDTGLVVSQSNSAQGLDELKVIFAQDGELRRFNSSQLGEHTTWWASTIHKTQGSEFDRVVVCLPEPPARVLARELLYTGITRARAHVSVVASEAALRMAIETPALRASGLVGHLRQSE